MKRVLLDHCVPRHVRLALSSSMVTTTFECGWAGKENGDLLASAEAAGFDVLVTADKNLRYQQHLVARRIAIVELPTNALPALMPLFPAIAKAVDGALPGSYYDVALVG